MLLALLRKGKITAPFGLTVEKSRLQSRRDSERYRPWLRQLSLELALTSRKVLAVRSAIFTAGFRKPQQEGIGR
jgi:hypothetical protein